MDLIYAQFKNNTIEDINVLLDYSFDEVYGIGDSVNDFECKVQMYNNKCTVDNVLYIEFTEYGGIIDTIKVDSKSGVVSYKGRSWHGVLNSHVIQPLASGATRRYSGEVNAILSRMITDMGLTSLFVVDAVPVADRTEKINSFSVRYEKGYDAIIRLMQYTECKLIMYFFDGRVHIGAVRAADFSHDEEFDNGQTPYKVSVTDNNVNHLICLGKGEGENRAAIHLFTDAKGIIQPYKLTSNPLEDSEYILDKRNQIFTGREEITEIFDYPSAEIITNYKRLTQKPSDWATQYFNKYYEDGEIDESTLQYKKRVPKEIVRDEYRVLRNQPKDWATEYGEYYFLDGEKDPTLYVPKDVVYSVVNGTTYRDCKTYVKYKEGDDGAEALAGDFSKVKGVKSNVVVEPHYEEQTGLAGGALPPADWNEKYSEYYTQKGTNDYESVGARSYDIYGADDTYDGLNQLTHTGSPLTQPPADWLWNFSNYVYKTTNVANMDIYTGIEGIHNYKAHKVVSVKTPTDWATTWSSYYVKAKKQDKIKKGTKIIKIEGTRYLTASDAMTQKILTPISKDKQYPKYHKGKFYIMEQIEDTAPNFADYAEVYEKITKQAVPLWEYPTKHYFKKVVTEQGVTAPSFGSNTFYELVEDIRQVPDFYKKPYYYAVEDRYRNLVKSGIEKLEQLADNSTLDIELELESNYDVLDIIGVTDEITNSTVVKPILRKKIQIKKDILSVDYEMD